MTLIIISQSFITMFHVTLIIGQDTVDADFWPGPFFGWAACSWESWAYLKPGPFIARQFSNFFGPLLLKFAFFIFNWKKAHFNLMTCTKPVPIKNNGKAAVVTI
jgi:hypothetical protein